MAHGIVIRELNACTDRNDEHAGYECAVDLVHDGSGGKTRGRARDADRRGGDDDIDDGVSLAIDDAHREPGRAATAGNQSDRAYA